MAAVPTPPAARTSMTTWLPSALTSSISVNTMPSGPDSSCTTQAFMSLELESGLLGCGEVRDLGPMRGDVLHRRWLVERDAVVLEQRGTLHLSAADNENGSVVGTFLGAQVGHDRRDEFRRELLEHLRRQDVLRHPGGRDR